jgi:outer membrane cobalamin receptor
MGNIKGSVYDENQNPLSYCAYSLMKDTTTILGGYCDENGNFVISNVKYGDYKLKIEFLGYESKIIDFKLDKEVLDLGKITLKAEGIRLKEQQVIAQPPIITYEQGKRVIKPSENVVNLGGTAIDVIEKVPGVSVDQNDNIQIRGSSNITLLINSRPTTLEVSEALKQIPASQIDRIEIITNPSAKYEAEGSTIINIILKQTDKEALSYSFNVRAGTYDNYGGNFLFGMSKNKIKFSTNLSYNTFTFPGQINAYRNFNNLELNSVGDGNRKHNPYGIRINLDYNLTKEDILSFEGNINHWSFDMFSNTKTYGSQIYNTEYSSTRGGLNSSVYFGYQRRFFNTGIFYASRSLKENTYNFDRDSLNNVINGSKTTEEGPLRNVLRFNIDFDNSKFGFGYLGNLWNSKEEAKFYKYNGGFYPYDSLSFDFRRITNALYGIYRDKFNKFYYELGLRIEDTRRNITNYSKQYFDFFPSFNLSYKLSGINQLFFNYSRRIQHPKPWQLEPFEIYLDEYTKEAGNPQLDPEYDHLFEIGFQNSYISIGSYYRKEENTIENMIIQKSNYILMFPENIGFSEFYGAEIALNYRKKFFEMNTSLNTYNYNVYSNSKRSSFSYEIKSSIRILFLQISGIYNSPKITSTGKTYENYYVDIGLKFPYKEFVFILNFNDVFKTSQFKSEFNNNGIYQVQTMKRNWPSIQFMTIYNFQSFRKLQRKQTEMEEFED